MLRRDVVKNNIYIYMCFPCLTLVLLEMMLFLFGYTKIPSGVYKSPFVFLFICLVIYIPIPGKFWFTLSRFDSKS